MGIEGCCGHHCDGSCSWMTSPGVQVMSREEINTMVDEALRPSLRERYDFFMQNHPRLYALITSISRTTQYF